MSQAAALSDPRPAALAPTRPAAPEPTRPAALHQALRAATTELHAAVEQRFERFDLGVRDGCIGFLAAQASALLPLERALERAGIARDLPDWPRRRRAGALVRDLAALGQAVPRQPATDPALTPGAEALGAAYVLEGSRLGAAVLLRRLGAGLPDGSLRHGARSGLWGAFLARLALLPEAAHPAAIRGAGRAFLLFQGDGQV